MTLHFDKEFSSRGEFLRFVYDHIYTLTAKHQEYFVDEGVDITLFHRSICKGSAEEHTMPSIHCMQDEGLKITAYGHEAGLTLEKWLALSVKLGQISSANCVTHRTSIPNIGQTSSKKIYYASQNYIPYRSCYKRGLYFTENTEPVSRYDSEAGLQLMLKEHMETFLRSVQKPNNNFSFVLTQYPEQYHWVEAIKPKPAYNGKKPAFEVTVATDLILPYCWSIGQNTGTGNGVFKKVRRRDL